MPPLKATRLQHIQDILAGRKRALLQKDVPARRVPNWNELAVKFIYPKVINELPELKHYLPEPSGKKEKRFPDRDFFFAVLYALYPTRTEELIGEARKDRGPRGVSIEDQHWEMAVSD